MRGVLLATLRTVARYARLGMGFGMLFLSIRLAWLSAAEWISDEVEGARADLQNETPQRAPDGNETQQDEAENKRYRLPKSMTGHRPNLDELEKLAGDLTPEEGTPSTPVPEPVRIRRLLVDIGPERSEVFVDGRLVGKTPFVGQTSCREGESVKITILPPVGAPLERTAPCMGEIIQAQR